MRRLFALKIRWAKSRNMVLKKKNVSVEPENQEKYPKFAKFQMTF